MIASSICPEEPNHAANRYVGKAEVRAGLASRFEGIPDVHYGNDQHWICGDLGVSEGLSPVRLNQVSKSRCEGLICSSSLVEKLSARILSGRYWSDGRGLTG